ncbi:MAG: 4-hydroxyphenylacetate catabolism regulatory protein HpaA [Thiolinea sp.]
MTHTANQHWIPNIILGQDYDQRYRDRQIHYDELNNLAGFFGRNMPVHRHAQYLQIHYISGGNSYFHLDEQIYNVHGPACFVTPASVPHSFMTEEGINGHVITLHEALLWQMMQDGLQEEMPGGQLRPLCIRRQAVTPEFDTQWQQLQQTLECIAYEWRHDALGKRLQLHALVRLMLIQILRLSQHQNRQPDGNTADVEAVNSKELAIFQEFSRLIEEHYLQHWQLSQYTAVLKISETRLNTICQRIANRSSKILVNDRLIQEARRRLIFTSLPVNSIAEQLGFQDPAYFARFFKKHCGMTAGHYRKQNQE